MLSYTYVWCKVETLGDRTLGESGRAWPDASGCAFARMEPYWKRPDAEVQRPVTSQQRVRSLNVSSVRLTSAYVNTDRTHPVSVRSLFVPASGHKTETRAHCCYRPDSKPSVRSLCEPLSFLYRAPVAPSNCPHSTGGHSTDGVSYPCTQTSPPLIKCSNHQE